VALAAVAVKLAIVAVVLVVPSGLAVSLGAAHGVAMLVVLVAAVVLLLVARRRGVTKRQVWSRWPVGRHLAAFSRHQRPSHHGGRR
jgi:hypothetical protein